LRRFAIAMLAVVVLATVGFVSTIFRSASSSSRVLAVIVIPLLLR